MKIFSIIKIAAPYFFISLGVGIVSGFWFTSTAIQLLTTNDPVLFLKEYIQYAFTLFGITLIGGIFETTKNHNNNNSKIIGRLFQVSLIFLFSAMCFLAANTIFYDTEIIYPSALIVKILVILGGLLVVAGVIYLMYLLIWHYIDVS